MAYNTNNTRRIKQQSNAKQQTNNNNDDAILTRQTIPTQQTINQSITNHTNNKKMDSESKVRHAKPQDLDYKSVCEKKRVSMEDFN